ncbi:E3 ubiquitin-protein ligase TTC3 isoform X1 [Osmerus mordax]|uniref:E3 ubiquitin-protein ligase TTC3 isoform X1 n=2 Tax=Osmerus mordax TaxID=8014 RepID=UPI00350F8D3E
MSGFSNKMSDSEDSGSEILECTNMQRGAKLIYERDGPFVALQPPDVIYERWNKIPISVKKKVAELMNVAAFWYHIVLSRQECNRITRWAVQVGFIDSNVSNDLSLKKLHKIEILEAVLRAMEKGSLRDDQTRHMVWISNKFNLHSPDVLNDALLWLERTGEPRIRQRVLELGHQGIVYTALQMVFSEYAHHTQAMGVDKKSMIKELSSGPSQWFIEKSEDMKSKGNDHFQKKKYESAVKYYTKALKYHPENHIIYGNRALCYIRSEKYLKAVGDGKRATLIKPGWSKGHYRFCEALFNLEEHRRALDSNILAQSLCREDTDGMRDLQQQYAKFSIEIEEIKAEKKQQIKKSPSNRPDSATRTYLEEDKSQGVKSTSKTEPQSTTKALQKKSLGVERDTRTHTVKNEGDTYSADTTNGLKTKTDTADKKSDRLEHNTTEKLKSKGRSQKPKEKLSPQAVGSSSSQYEAVRSAVQDACAALTDQRSRNAEQAFSRALGVLALSTAKDLGLSTIDQILLIYGRALALVEIGQPEELAEAEREFEKIKLFEERTFQCLVYFGIGKMYLKWNRFPKALEQFSYSLQMVKKQITPGKLSWPTTKDIVKDTQPDYFKGSLETSIEMCKFPPKPDAICRYSNCAGHSKLEIFFTDPDFKGFIRIVCCQNCIVEYHISCWKTVKTTSFSDRNEKEFLLDMCFTPDCRGVICNIQIYGSTGILKCKFEAPVTKPMGPVKVKVNQKCTSLKKLKSKEDRKHRRKQHKQANSQTQPDQNDQTPSEKNDNTAVEPEEKAPSSTWLLCRDHILLQINENRKLLQDENSHNVASLLRSLKPWIDLDHQKGSALVPGARDRLKPESLWEVAELLLERKNRVWGRVFIQSLSGSRNTSPRLHDWALQLDNAGMKAACVFIERHAEHLEQLDLSPLLLFPPLQDMFIEKFGTRPEFFSRGGLTVTEYLKQAPHQEMRLFIWTLEEHREQYTSCHSVLDEYFEMMDGLCVVIRKTENENLNNSPSKNKNRNRKRKQKEPKNIIYMGVRSTREEDEEDFFDDENSLMILDPSDPFSVPNRLRDRVAAFEDQYNSSNHSTLHKQILTNNNPDPTKESLYDYFAQILEQHGPLGAQDPLLVGLLDSFPPEAQQKIQEAGGLQPFLLSSLRFVMNGDLIGLMKHAVTLQYTATAHQQLNHLEYIGDPSYRLDLNPSAGEFHPCSGDMGMDDFSETVSFGEGMTTPVRHEPVLTGYHRLPYNPHMFYPCPPQPNTYVSSLAGAFSTQGVDEAMLYVGTNACTAGHEQYRVSDCGDLDQFVSEVDENSVWETLISSGSTSRKLSVKTAAVQATCDSNNDVAVNTEPYEPFEINNGEMSRKEKDNTEFKKQIHQMKENYSFVKLRRQEEISGLKEEYDNINQNIKISNRELALFQKQLEEEVKKDQQEKRDNQETLKAMKAEMKELLESQESLTKAIKEKKKEYETQLDSFLELSNQSAGEKMSLEDEIKRCRDLCSSTALRSHTSQVFILESQKGRGLRCLFRSVTDARAILAKLQEVAPRYPPHLLQPAIEAWSTCLRESEEKISTTEAQYQEQLEQVKKGARLNTLPPITIPYTPQPPPIPLLHPTQQLPPHQLIPAYPDGYGGPVPVRGPMYPHQGPPRPPAVESPAPGEQPGGAGVLASSSSQSVPAQHHTQPQHHAQASLPNQGPRHPAPQPNVFEKILERLGNMFPHFSRPVLMKYVQDTRTANGGDLNFLSYQEVVNRVAQLILDKQESSRDVSGGGGTLLGGQALGVTALRSASPAPARSADTSPPVWKSLGSHGHQQSKALNMEDPCIICHDDMTQENMCVLECRHSFHRQCIKSWLKEQSTCPTCREHALLPEDFPSLPGKLRRGHTPFS